MAIRMACACGERYEVADDQAGRSSRCPECGRRMTAPVFVVARTAPRSATVARAGDGPWIAGRSQGIALAMALVVVGAASAWVIARTFGRVDSVGARAAAPHQAGRAAPPRPATQPLDEGQQVALDHLLRYEGDPASVEVVEWWPSVAADPWATSIDFDRVVYLVVRSRNEHGALVVGPRLYYLKDRAVVFVERPGANFAIWQWDVNNYYPPKVPAVDPLAQRLQDLANPAVPGKRRAPGR